MAARLIDMQFRRNTSPTAGQIKANRILCWHCSIFIGLKDEGWRRFRRHPAVGAELIGQLVAVGRSEQIFAGAAMGVRSIQRNDRIAEHCQIRSGTDSINCIGGRAQQRWLLVEERCCHRSQVPPGGEADDSDPGRIDAELISL